MSTSKRSTKSVTRQAKKDTVKQYFNLVRNRIIQKEQLDRNRLNSNLINNIIYNEKANIVATFKDYLIYDDVSEFLKRIYKIHESLSRLPKICEFYESYSKIFPNYTNLPEAKYMYKNIKRKQKVIDNNQMQLDEENEIPDDEPGKVIDSLAYNSIMNQTQTVNSSKRIDDTINSFEGIIESIGKAEVNIINSKPSINAKFVSPPISTPTPGESKIRQAVTTASKGVGTEKNPYNFKLNLNILKGNNDVKDNVIEKINNNNKVIINQIDELQKLKLKVNAGLINSARSKNEKQIRELYNELNTKQIHVSPEEMDPKKMEDPKAVRQNLLIKDLNTINYEDCKILNKPTQKEKEPAALSARNSKIYECVEITNSDGKNVFKREKIQKPFHKKVQSNIIIEENTEDPKLKSKKLDKELNPNSERKIYHKSTSSMSKITPSNIYNNFHIVNNYQNIIYNNNPPVENINLNENLIKQPFSARTDFSEKTKHLKNKSKTDSKNVSNDLFKIKQNVKKLIGEFSQKSKENLGHMTRTISNENSKANLKIERVPLSARVEKELLTITTNKDTIDKDTESERTAASKKLISSILKSDSKLNKILSSRNSSEKVTDKTLKKSVRGGVRTTSTITIERKNSILSSNTSAVSQTKKQIKDLKMMSNDKSKSTISPKNNIIYNNIYDKIRKNSSSRIESKNGGAQVKSNPKINVQHFESNQVGMNDPKTKPILKIKNFFEATKLNNIQCNKAVSDRFNQNMITKIFNPK